MPSFDIVSKTEITSVDNALQGVIKEMQVRYDFKGSKSEVSKLEESILIVADDELKRRQVEELLITHLTRKGVDTRALEFEKPEQAGGNTVRQTVTVKQGVQRDVAQKIVKAIKASKLKTQASIQGDEVRVTGKKRDDLQETMAMIKGLDIDLPLQFENFRD
ncbi:YajQ family cyclic di-GMP-binding protein [bacterium]|nr:YajQ family cyclic di-GMP-binding protein [bacterium]